MCLLTNCRLRGHGAVSFRQIEETPPRPTNSQISLKPEGEVFVAGRDSAQQLRALCHAALSDPGVLGGPVPGMDRVRPGTLKKSPRPLRRGLFCSCSRVASYRLAWRLAPPLAGAAWLPRTSPPETSLTHSEPLPL